MFSSQFHKRARELNEMAGKPYKRARKATKKTFVRATAKSENKRFARLDTKPERKRKDTSIQVTTDAPGDVYPLNTIAQGTDNINRIGRQIVMKSYQYKFMWSATGSNLGTAGSYPNGANTLRIAIVYDKQSNQTGPTIDEIWQIGTAVPLNPFILRNLDNYDRFTVLSDEIHVITTAGPNGVAFEKYGAISLPTRYDGTGGTIADITTGGLHLVVMDTNNTVSALSNLQGIVRVTFTDM